MKFDNQLRYAVKIINQYKGEIPLTAWLKNFFRENRQMGSKDRKTVSGLVYAYYRTGYALRQLPPEEAILAGFYLATTAPTEILKSLKPEYNDSIQTGITEKANFLRSRLVSFDEHDLFPWRSALSDGIDADLFCRSFLIQPDVFLRIRPGMHEVVISKLKRAAVHFELTDADCIAVSAGNKIDSIIDLDREAIVQDRSSQHVRALFQPALYEANENLTPGKRGGLKVWDSCAASGGKSIMAYDLNSHIQLTVSDVRPSILHNLQKRFETAGIKRYAAHVVDLSVEAALSAQDFREQSFDLIIADLPCSGSGTWSRTPEQLYFFKKEKIDYYSNLQEKIVRHLFPYLKPGGSLVYITCSVFKKENEEVVDFIRNDGKLHCETMELFKGYDKKADTLFAARFTL